VTDIRGRLADAIADVLETKQEVDLAVPFARGRVAYQLVSVLLSLPGIAIVDTEAAKQQAYEFWCSKLHVRTDHLGTHPDWIGDQVGELFALLAAANAAEATQ
jgi:hypothetical protein